jgi:phenylacetate-CoA ligase
VATTASADRQYWNPDRESVLNTVAMRAHQLDALRQRIAALHAKGGYWHRRLTQNGVTPDLAGLEEFAAALPVVTKKDMFEVLEGHGGDYDRYLDDVMLADAGDIELFAATSGTTGEPVPYPFTARDLSDGAGEMFKRVFWRAGVRPGRDRVVHAFALGLFAAGVPMVQAVARMGVTVIPVGAESGAAKILKITRQFRGTVLVCTPSLAEHLIERAPEVLGAPVSSLGLRALICGGEPGAGIPEIRDRIESAYGAPLYDFGGGFGGSCGHHPYQGLHWVGDDLCLYELVDERGRAVPLSDGAVGEAVFTTLTGDGWINLRTSHGDIHRVTTSPCPCGASGFRYQVIGRSDDMLKVKGVIVYPASIDAVISSLHPRVTGEFRIVIDEPPPRVVPPLQLKVEVAENVSSTNGIEMLERELKDACASRLRVTPAVTWVPAGSLDRASHKTNFFERTYV